MMGPLSRPDPNRSFRVIGRAINLSKRERLALVRKSVASSLRFDLSQQDSLFNLALSSVSTPFSMCIQKRTFSSSSDLTSDLHDSMDESEAEASKLNDVDESKRRHLLIERIQSQEFAGGKMRSSQYGVLHEDPKIDMRILIENYSVSSLASALREREDVLQHCANLLEQKDWESLASVLRPFQPRFVKQRRRGRQGLDVANTMDAASLEVIRKALMRMPRTVTTAHTSRAGVVVPICLDKGVPSLLLEKRAPNLRAHPDEVCLPGGMVCSVNDTTIVATCLREMNEEIGGIDNGNIQVLGVLRCNWGDVHHLVGVAVTPVVCFLGELPENLEPNPDEVANVFTIPLINLLDESSWVHKKDLAPIFVGGPEVIWGLTGYILQRFTRDILQPHNVTETNLLVDDSR